jgi:hypothetical protein
VDLLAALTRHEERLLEPERPEDGAVERERRGEVPAHEVDVAEPDDHVGRRRRAALASSAACQ